MRKRQRVRGGARAPDGVLKTQTYVASQGRCLGRDGQVTVEFDGTTIWLGGHAVTCVEGVLQP